MDAGKQRERCLPASIQLFLVIFYLQQRKFFVNSFAGAFANA
jgi:hypothetical protein